MVAETLRFRRLSEICQLIMRLKSQFSSALVANALLLVLVLGCDSPPWSRFIVANHSPGDVTVRFYTPYPTVASPYIYSAEEWTEGRHFYSGTPRDQFKINEEESYFEVVLRPGMAVEINRAPYPDVEESIDANFLIDRLDINGPSGEVSWSGRREIFSRLVREEDTLFSPHWGRSPRYVYYYR